MFLWKKKHASKTPQLLKPLPRLHTDILWDIIPELCAADLASAARISKEWLPIARSCLYNRIALRATFTVSYQIAGILRSCEHLRSLIRHLSIECPSVGDSGPWFELLLGGWITLLPEHSLVSVELRSFHNRTTLDTLLGYPAVSTARHVILHAEVGITQPRLAKLLQNPHLRGLSLFNHELPVPIDYLSLTRLSIAISHPSATLPAFLDALESPTQLRHFDLQVQDLAPHEATSVLGALKRHCKSLKHFSLVALEKLSEEPFMDDFVSSLSSAEYVCCAYGTYTVQGLLPRLSPSVRSLVLIWGLFSTTVVRDPNGYGQIMGAHLENVPFPSEELALIVSRLSSASQLSLTHLTVVLPKFIRNKCLPVANACASAGVSFKRLQTGDLLVDHGFVGV